MEHVTENIFTRTGRVERSAEERARLHEEALEKIEVLFEQNPSCKEQREKWRREQAFHTNPKGRPVEA